MVHVKYEQCYLYGGGLCLFLPQKLVLTKANTGLQAVLEYKRQSLVMRELLMLVNGGVSNLLTLRWQQYWRLKSSYQIYNICSSFL